MFAWLREMLWPRHQPPAGVEQIGQGIAVAKGQTAEMEQRLRSLKARVEVLSSR